MKAFLSFSEGTNCSSVSHNGSISTTEEHPWVTSSALRGRDRQNTLMFPLTSISSLFSRRRSVHWSMYFFLRSSYLGTHSLVHLDDSILYLSKRLLYFSPTQTKTKTINCRANKASKHQGMCMLVCVPRKRRTAGRSGVAMFLSCGD
jgi:hypothetical protein